MIHRLCWNCEEVIDTSDDQVTWKYLPGGGDGPERPYDRKNGIGASAPPAWAAHRGACLDAYKWHLGAKKRAIQAAREASDAAIACAKQRLKAREEESDFWVARGA